MSSSKHNLFFIYFNKINSLNLFKWCNKICICLDNLAPFKLLNKVIKLHEFNRKHKSLNMNVPVLKRKRPRYMLKLLCKYSTRPLRIQYFWDRSRNSDLNFTFKTLHKGGQFILWLPQKSIEFFITFFIFEYYMNW